MMVLVVMMLIIIIIAVMVLANDSGGDSGDAHRPGHEYCCYTVVILQATLHSRPTVH
jgi:hypothetical protein